jgi:hypothetical protein
MSTEIFKNVNKGKQGDGPFVSVPLLPIDIRKKPSWLAPFTVLGLHRNIERIFERPLFNRSYDSQIQSVKNSLFNTRTKTKYFYRIRISP